MIALRQILSRLFKNLSLINKSPLPSRERARVRGSFTSEAPSPHSSPVKGEEEKLATAPLAIVGILAAIILFTALFAHSASPDEMLANRKPEVTIDLATQGGAQLVKGEWRYSDTKIVQVDFKVAGADGQPTGAANQTYDLAPHAGAAAFDDSQWEVIGPTTLDKRRSAGKLAFNWYRIMITVPERVGNFDPGGSTLVFATSIDDYPEIWVDGELPRAMGQSGGSVIKGWNAENRLIVGRDVRPGQKFQLAIFGINGPLSNPPTAQYGVGRRRRKNPLPHRTERALPDAAEYPGDPARRSNAQTRGATLTRARVFGA